MNTKTLQYAKMNLDAFANENGFAIFISQGGLYLQLPNGRNLKISDDEVEYQAEEYLKSEIELIKF
jgi:hypothetical protein